jgi:hypothetical protein
VDHLGQRVDVSQKRPPQRHDDVGARVQADRIVAGDLTEDDGGRRARVDGRLAGLVFGRALGLVLDKRARI